MKQSSYKGKSPLPDFVIDAACAGNAEAVERVLQHYDGSVSYTHLTLPTILLV